MVPGDPITRAARRYGQYLGGPALAAISHRLFGSPHTLRRHFEGRYRPLATAELMAFLGASGIEPGAFFDWALGRGLGTPDLYLWELTRIDPHERRRAQSLASRNLGHSRSRPGARSVLDESATPAARVRSAWATVARPPDAPGDSSERLEAWGVLANAARRAGRAVRAAVFARHALPELATARPLYRGKLFQRLGYLAFHFSDHRCALALIERARQAHAEAGSLSHVGRCHVDAAQVYYHGGELDRALLEAELASRLLDPGETANRVALHEVRILTWLELGRAEWARSAWHCAMGLGHGLGGLYQEHLRMLDGRILLAEGHPASAFERLVEVFDSAIHIEDRFRCLYGLYALVAALRASRRRELDGLMRRLHATVMTARTFPSQEEARAVTLALAELRRYRLGEATRSAIARLERPSPRHRWAGGEPRPLSPAMP